MENLTIQHTAFARWYIFDRMYKINRMDGPGSRHQWQKNSRHACAPCAALWLLLTIRAIGAIRGFQGLGKDER
jgi:hypothetical protein